MVSPLVRQSSIRNKCSALAKVAFEAHTLCDSSRQLPTGNQTAKFKQVIPLIKLSPDALPFFAFPASVLISTGIALAGDKND
jgi:hypothetical protein